MEEVIKKYEVTTDQLEHFPKGSIIKPYTDVYFAIKDRPHLILKEDIKNNPTWFKEIEDKEELGLDFFEAQREALGTFKIVKHLPSGKKGHIVYSNYGINWINTGEKFYPTPEEMKQKVWQVEPGKPKEIMKASVELELKGEEIYLTSKNNSINIIAATPRSLLGWVESLMEERRLAD